MNKKVYKSGTSKHSTYTHLPYDSSSWIQHHHMPIHQAADNCRTNRAQVVREPQKEQALDNHYNLLLSEGYGPGRPDKPYQ